MQTGIAVKDMHSFVFRQVKTASPSLSYLQHTEETISASIANLLALFHTPNPGYSTRAFAAVIWLKTDESQSTLDAFVPPRCQEIERDACLAGA